MSKYLFTKLLLMNSLNIYYLRAFSATCATKPRGYAIQHIPVRVPSQDELEWLRQEGHLV